MIYIDFLDGHFWIVLRTHRDNVFVAYDGTIADDGLSRVADEIQYL